MRQMGFYISSLSRAPCTKAQVRHYQVAPSYNYKWTDIHYEASRGNVEKLILLLTTSDRDLVDRKDYYGKTPLYWAAYKGQKLAMELLLQHGASVNSCCKHGGTPLHAAIGLFPDCVLLLIQHGADVNLQDNWGVTPMYLAACSGQMECIRLLVQAGADITYKNKWCRVRILERIEWRSETEPLFVPEKTGSPPKRLAAQTAFISWIETFSRQPRSLKHLSRLAIRAAMGHQRLRAVETFNLPLSLKGYLMFEDLVLQDTP